MTAPVVYNHNLFFDVDIWTVAVLLGAVGAAPHPLVTCRAAPAHSRGVASPPPWSPPRPRRSAVRPRRAAELRSEYSSYGESLQWTRCQSDTGAVVSSGQQLQVTLGPALLRAPESTSGASSEHSPGTMLM